MKSFEIAEIEATPEEVMMAIRKAGQDLAPLSMISCRDQLQAETLVLDVILLSLEVGWFCRSVNWGDEFTHMEFREDLFSLLWKKIGEARSLGLGGARSVYGESEMPFFQLDMRVRAILYLRTKARFSFEQIERILEDESAANIEIELNQVREELLGRKLVPSIGELF